MSADNEFAQHAGDTQYHDTGKVYQDKGCSAILTSHVWESPYIAQTYSRTGCSQYDTYSASEVSSMIAHMLF
jgi:hypothetical protein